MTIRHRRRILTLLGGGLVIAVAGGVALLWFLSGDAPTPVGTSAATTADADAAAGGSAQDDAEAGPATDPATGTPDDPGETPGDPDETVGDPAGAVDDPTGTWTVDTQTVPFDPDAGTGTFAGYRVDEELAIGGATTAVGRSPDVAGTVTMDGTTITGAGVEVGLAGLVSDASRRDGAVQRMFGPDATARFVLTDPATVDRVPGPGEVTEVTATGELTVEGVSHPVEVVLQASVVDDDLLVVTGSIDVALSDLGVEAPRAPIVLSVSDDAVIEWQLYLRR